LKKEQKLDNLKKEEEKSSDNENDDPDDDDEFNNNNNTEDYENNVNITHLSNKFLILFL
jgi:hypothetical protein